MNTQNTLTISDKKTLASNIKLDENNKIVCSIATISDAILNLEKSKDKADYGIAVLVNTLANIDNEVYKSLDISYTDKEGKTITVDNWTKYCKYEFDYSQSHCSKLKRVADTFFTLSNADSFLTLKANDNFDGGFRVAVNNSGAYYDYSAEAVVEMLSNYLSPKVTALLKEAE